MFELRCGVQDYEWGKIGHDSKVAALKASADPDFVLNPSKKYAEVNLPVVAFSTLTALPSCMKH